MYPRVESNHDINLRRIAFYPLNYKGILKYKDKKSLV